jgi:hypothetical protein
MERLVEAGTIIAMSNFLCGGYEYDLEGECLGTETFGRYIMCTTIFPAPKQLSISFEQHGNSFQDQGQPPMSIFCGMDQPFSLWRRVTVRAKTELPLLSEFLAKHGVTHTLSEGKIDIASRGHFICVMAGPYINGLKFVVMEERELVPMVKEKKW